MLPSEEQTQGQPLPGEAVVVLSTAEEEEAHGLARMLVEERLAACVSMVHGVQSVYRWEGEVTTEGEVLMLIKTTGQRLGALQARFIEAHSYEVPEFLVLRPEEVESSYLKWLQSETAPTPPTGE